jgi:hypothetical protein
MRRGRPAASIVAMTTRLRAAARGGPATALPADRYVFDRTAAEYERLRAQARVREAATGRLFDQVGLAPGARCLDAGVALARRCA